VKNLFGFDLTGFDSDFDGLPDTLELALGLDPYSADTDGDGTSDGDEDTDGDHVPNLRELLNHTDPLTTLDANSNGIPDDWETEKSGQFAVWPPVLSGTLVGHDQQMSVDIFLRNDTPAPVAFSSGYQDASTGAPYVWEEISSTGTLLRKVSSGDNVCQELFFNDFAFPFYGGSFDSVVVNSNGVLLLTGGTTFYGSVNLSFPNPAQPYAMIAPFWCDLYPGLAGDVYAKQTTDNLIVQYQNVMRYGGGGIYTFQVVLHSDGTIEFRYKEMAGSLDQATVGVQDPSGTKALQLAYCTPYVSGSSSVIISPRSGFFSVDETSGTIAAHSTIAISAEFRSLDLPYAVYSGTTMIAHNAPAVVSPAPVLFHLNARDPDSDGDGLVDVLELLIGSNPNTADSNGDGLNDGAAYAAGLSLVSSDTDADGVSNVDEILLGLNPFSSDSDGDGVGDATDAYPLDPALSEATPGDVTAPEITITFPTQGVTPL
jgi:hypothetical protein